jgi:hypothetical protein
LEISWKHGIVKLKSGSGEFCRTESEGNDEQPQKVFWGCVFPSKTRLADYVIDCDANCYRRFLLMGVGLL